MLYAQNAILRAQKRVLTANPMPSNAKKICNENENENCNKWRERAHDLEKQLEILRVELENTKRVANSPSSSVSIMDLDADENVWRVEHQALKVNLQTVQDELNQTKAEKLQLLKTIELNSNEYREKSLQFEANLKQIKIDLEFANTDRRYLLDQVLNLTGKARIMCRFRPPSSSESAHKMKMEINPSKNKLFCK